MPIEPGSPWGETVARRDDLPCFDGESQLGRFLSGGERKEHALVALTRGRFVDLTGGSHTNSSTMRRYSCDVLEYHADDGRTRRGETIGSISIVTRGSMMKWGLVYVSNLGQVADGSVSDRSHPNDGRFELLDAQNGLTIRDLLALRHRVKRGQPVAHDGVQRRSVSHAQWIASRMWVRVDGDRPFSCSSFEVFIRPDAAEVFVSSIPDRH